MPLFQLALPSLPPYLILQEKADASPGRTSTTFHLKSRYGESGAISHIVRSDKERRELIQLYMKLFHLIEVRSNYPPLWRAEEIAREAALPAQRSDRRRAQPCGLPALSPKSQARVRQFDTRSFASHLTSSIVSISATLRPASSSSITTISCRRIIYRPRILSSVPPIAHVRARLRHCQSHHSETRSALGPQRWLYFVIF